jgi:glycosyltransferase involved in cell wall biosynthesis
MGCPVIVPDLGALPETILAPGQSQTGFTGWLFPPRDIASLASRISRALALKAAERAAIGSRAQAHVAANFTLAQMQGATLAVYDELLGTDLAERFKRASPAELGA